MKMVYICVIALLFAGCTATHNPFINVGASKTVNVGGVNVGVGVHDIIRLGK